MKRLKLLGVLVALAVAAYPLLAKKKKPEEITQTLELPKDPPATVTAETSRLVFHVSPLSAKGLLSQQVRDALKALLKSSGGSTIVKLRAFVAGSGDLRRVPAIVSETFTEKHLPLPAVSIVQVGALPLVGAQVVIESTAMAKKDVNQLGLVFISGQGAKAPGKAISDLKTALNAVGSEGPDMLQVTCFAGALEDGEETVRAMAPDFHGAAIDMVQLQRTPYRGMVECEGIARLKRPMTGPFQLLNPPGMNSSPNFSQMALVSAPKIVLTGTILSYGYHDSDARLAFQRLAKDLDQGGSSIHDVAMTHIYPLSQSLLEQVRKIRFEFLNKERPPAATMLSFDGLAAMEAGFAIDVIAIPR
jgi:enamine deaminase RidA (YjgF/YER057c/UK114 family)